MEPDKETKILNAPDEKGHKAALQAAQAPPKPIVTQVSRCCVREYWAVVETKGGLVRGRNVTRVKWLALGQYEVIFTDDVSLGVYVATIGRPGILTEPSGQIGVALRCCLTGGEVNKGVWVDTHDSTGAPADRAFHLIVLLD
jgi:hypothetical protein